MIEKDCNLTTPKALPPHPFFETTKDQATFGQCIDGLHRVSAVIELCNALKLEEEHAGLPPDAAYGFYWITVMNRSALAYISNRLLALDREDKTRHQEACAHLSALYHALQTLDSENRERLLNQTATQMNATRPDIDQFMEQLTTS